VHQVVEASTRRAEPSVRRSGRAAAGHTVVARPG